MSGRVIVGGAYHRAGILARPGWYTTGMSQTLCLLGREAALSLAEIYAVARANGMTIIAATEEVAVIDHPKPLDPGWLDRLGGTVKMAEVIDSWPVDAAWPQILEHCSAEWLSERIPQGRVEYGVSVYGLAGSQRRHVQAHFLGLKHALKEMGRSA